MPDPRKRRFAQFDGGARAAFLAQRVEAFRSPYGRRQLAALSVHVFTASGAALGFFALIAAIRHDFSAMFWWLAIALVVDGIDGAFARRADVTHFAARYSGAVLDLVVDYLTYVVVPTYALFVSGLLPPLWAGLAAVVIVGTLMRGGRGSIRGTVIGVLLLGVIGNMLNMFDRVQMFGAEIRISTYTQGLVKGLVILAAVLVQRGRRQ